MAFWNRSLDSKDLPESMRDKNPEEITAILHKYAEMERSASTDKQRREELEQAAAARQQEFDQMKGRLQELEAAAAPQPTTAVPPTQQQQQEEPPSPWADPSGFVRNEMKPLANVALVSGMMTAKMYFEQGLTARDRKILKKYEKEVEQGVNTFAPEARVMPQAWLNMFLYVKGAHEADIRKAEDENPESFFSEAPSRGPAQEPEPEEKLTKEEEEVCKTFHYDPKQYLATRRQAELKGGARGVYATYQVPTASRSENR